MLTFTRAGQTSLYVESAVPPGTAPHFGTLGILLPEKTPRLPTQLTTEDAWYWRHQTQGAGWFLFLAPGYSFPDPSTEAQLLKQFLDLVRKQLPGVAPQQSSGYAWIVGDPRTTTFSLVRLDMVGTGNPNSGRNPSTPTYDQTHAFGQFSIIIQSKTEVRMKPDFTGVEILTTPAGGEVHMTSPIAPFWYRPVTTVSIALEGELRGALQFTLEPLSPSQLAVGSLDPAMFYYLRPETNGTTPPRLLRYPLIDTERTEGTLDLQVTFYPVRQHSSFINILPEGGTPKRIASHFRTIAGHQVHLHSREDGRFYFRLRPNLDSTLSQLQRIYYLAPSGGFEVEAEGPLDDEHMARILGGIAGTEYIRVKSRNGAGPGDVLSFLLDQSAYAETFGAIDVGDSVMLMSNYQTSWVRVYGADGEERFYYAQPVDAPLFQSNGIFSNTTYLDFSEKPTVSLTEPASTAFPMTPVAGVMSIDDRVDIDIYERFEQRVLTPYRDRTIKRAGAPVQSLMTTRSLRRLAQLNVTTVKDTTPQGLLVEKDVANNRFTRVVLGKLEGTEMAINDPTVLLEQALGSASLFLVISHLENVGDFSENVLSMAAWNFVADIAATQADNVSSIMIFKFVAGTTFQELVDDASQWTNPDDFTNERPIQTRLQDIITDMREKALGNDPDSDADVARYYATFIREVIDAPNWEGIVVFDAQLGDFNELPREVRGLLPGMVVSKSVPDSGNTTTYWAPTNQIDPAFKAHHLRLNVARVLQAADGTLEGVDNSSASALIDYKNGQAQVTGLAKFNDNTNTTVEVDAVENVSDFTFRLKFMRVTFENSYIKNFISDVTLRFHKLFKEVPSLQTLPDGTTPVNQIDLSGALQQLDGIPTYVFRFGCVDPLKKNFVVCAARGLDGQRAIMRFPDVSPVIEQIEASRVDYTMLQIGINVGESNVTEWVLAGYMTLRELGGRDFFSYDKVGFGGLSLQSNYNSIDPEAVTDEVAKPEEMGNPFWIFYPNTMKFDTLRGEARDGSIVKQAPLNVKGIAESVSTFSAGDTGVFPIPGLVPMSKAMFPYIPAGAPGVTPSPVTYIISYAMTTSGIGANVSTGGLMDIIVHTGWEPSKWTASGENVFYTALQIGSPLTNLDIGKKGMFKIGLTDFGFGEIPTSTNDRIFFIYVNGLTISILRWTAKASLMLFAPAPSDEGFAGAFGSGGQNISSWFGSFSVGKGSSGTSSIDTLTTPPALAAKPGAPVMALASAALRVLITRNPKNEPTHYQLVVHGFVQNIGGIDSIPATTTVRARLYTDGSIGAPGSGRSVDVTFTGALQSSERFEIFFPQDEWPGADTSYTADVRITGSDVSDARGKTIKQSNTISLRADEGKPDSGSPIIEISYLAVGRGIRLRRGTDPEGDPTNLNVRPAPRTVGDALQLMQQMLPSGETGPDLYNVLRDIYAPSAGMMVGVDITIMGWLRLAVIANEADEIYGGLIEIKDADKLPEFAKKLAGIRIEILYRRLWDDSDLGVYEGTLVLPDSLRIWDVGGFSVTLPVISLQVYTDNSFLIDLGFPTGSFLTGYDFSRSFAIQGMVGPFPVMGAVGLYFGKLSAEADYTLPDIDPDYGVWKSSWKFGFAAKLGFGKSYKRGPISFEFSLTAQLVFQGTAAGIERVNTTNSNVPAPADYLALDASLQLVLYIMGKLEVQKSGFRLSASLMIRATLGVQFRYQTGVDIKIQLLARLEAELKIELDLKLFTISISVSFTFEFKPSFTIKNNDRPEWLDHTFGTYPPSIPDTGDNVLAGSQSTAARALASRRMLAAASIVWVDPAALFSGSTFDGAFTYADGDDVMDLRDDDGKLPLDLVFTAPFTIDRTGTLTGVASFVIPEMHLRYLQAGIFIWVTKSVLGSATDGSTSLGVSQLSALREAVEDGRPELTQDLLNQFLENYGLAFHSGDDEDAEALLTPAGATETVATVFPMLPDYQLVYPEPDGDDDITVNFDDETVRGSAYYTNLDRYLRALGFQVESLLGADMMPDAGTVSVADKALATHVFEAYFELLVEAGVEQTIEQYLPRAADASTITGTWSLATIAGDIIDRMNPAEVKSLSGFVSRLMLGGHQLPISFSDEPLPQPSGFQSLGDLTGQQVPVGLPTPDEDAEDEGVIWTLTLRDSSGEPLTATTVTVSEHTHLSTLATNLQDAIGFGKSGGAEPRVERIVPFIERNLDYPVDEQTPVSSNGTTMDRELLRFAQPLLTRLTGLQPGSGLTAGLKKATYAGAFSTESPTITAVPSNMYEWALVVPFTVTKVLDTLASSVDASTRVYLKDTYQFAGADELTRGRIAGLLTHLVNGEPAITGVSVVQSTELDGVSGLAALEHSARVLKTNLSTISAPRGLAAVAPPPEKFYGELNQSDIFASLRLLWEASVVNAPGFYFEYDGSEGLPDTAFDNGDTAMLSLVVRFSSSNPLPSYANGIWYGADSPANEHFYVELLDPSSRVAIPVGVPGTFGFYIGREVVDGTIDNARVRSAATLFNLVTYRIKDAGTHVGNWSVGDENWSLPFSPLKIEQDAMPETVRNSEWQYELAVPWTKFLTGNRTNSPISSTTGNQSPYDLVGGTLELELAALDTFGNRFPRTVQQSFNVLYTDALQPIAQWSEVRAAYHVNTDGQIVVILEFSADQLTADDETTLNRVRALRMQYETIWFQLEDPNTSVTLHTTLLDGNGELTLSGEGSVNTRLSDWVAEILNFLNGRLTGTAAAPPEMKVITTTAIDRASRDAQAQNINKLQVSVVMARPESMVDSAASNRLLAVATAVSDIKADTEVEPNLPDLPDLTQLPGVTEQLTRLEADSLVGFAQRFESAFPEMRLASGEAEGGDQTLWAVRMGRDVGADGPGIRYSVDTSSASYYANAPLSTRYESCTIEDPDDSSKTVVFSLVDMDELGRRFVSVVDDMLSQENVVTMRRADADGFGTILRAKETLATGVPRQVLPIFTDVGNDGRASAAREVYRQAILKSLAATYDVDTVISYDVTTSNTDSVAGPPPNLFGTIVSLEPEVGRETPFVVGNAKIRLGNDENGNAPKLSFTLSTDHDSERAQLPALLAYQVTYVEHNIQTTKPVWAPPTGSYEYRGSTWLKLVLPDNPRPLDEPLLPNDPIVLSPSGPTNVPIPLREIPTTPSILRQLGTPEVAEGESVTLEKAAAWEYEYQIERPRAAQDRIYLHLAFNQKINGMSLAQASETLLHALCRFDLLYSRLTGADLPVEQRTEPTATDLLGLLPAIEDVSLKWGGWEPDVPIVEYTWVKDDWAYAFSESIVGQDSPEPEISIRLTPLPIKEPVAGQPEYGIFPEIRVPDPLTNGPQELTHAPDDAPLGSVVTYGFTWSGVVPDDHTRGLVFSNLNVLKTENARGRIWLTRNENLGELDNHTTNERFIYRSGASEFSDPVQPYIDRTVPVDIAASVATPSESTLAGYLQQLFREVFGIAINNGYPWPLIKLGARYGYDPRELLAPPFGPDAEDQYIVYVPVMQHVPFEPTSAEQLANDIAGVLQTWEEHWDIASSPSKATGFYEFDLSVFSTLNRSDRSSPMLRLRRLWIRRFE